MEKLNTGMQKTSGVPSGKTTKNFHRESCRKTGQQMGHKDNRSGRLCQPRSKCLWRITQMRYEYILQLQQSRPVWKIRSAESPANVMRQMEETLMTTEELAVFLRLKVGTLEKQRSLGDPGHPPYLKIKNTVRYSPAEVKAWLRRNQIDNAIGIA